MEAMSSDWMDSLRGEFSKPYYAKLYKTINEEYRNYTVFPPAGDILRAFSLTPLSEVTVVILGHDH